MGRSRRAVSSKRSQCLPSFFSAFLAQGCVKSTELVDFVLGFETNYTFWDHSEEALDWSTDERNATLFMCSEKEETCIDAVLVCNGMNECPNGEDENPGGMDCEAYECPYPEYGVL